MRFTSWDNTREVELSPCPFCGGEPEMRHVGNDHMRKREIEIKCRNCSVKMRHATLRHGFGWLEDIASAAWNQRTPVLSNEEAGR